MNRYTFHLPMGEDIYVVIVYATDISHATDRAIALDGTVVYTFKGTTPTGRLYLQDIKDGNKSSPRNDEGLTS